jgi:hypothetical protein
MAIFAMCTLKIPVTVINVIDCIRRDCLWRGSNENAHRNPLVVWDKVCCPRNRGGLGVLNVKIHNTTLLLKFIHKFYDREDIPWLNLIWATHYSGARSPMPILKQALSSGSMFSSWLIISEGMLCPGLGWKDKWTILLWHDVWKNISPRFTFPSLFSFAKKKE